MTKLVVTSDIGLRVRAQPSTDGARIGLLPAGAEVEPSAIVAGWATLPLTAGGAAIGDGYASMDYLADPDVPAYADPSFTASPSAITAGETVTLSWSIAGIAGIWLDGMPEEGVMSRTRNPVTDTLYTLTVLYTNGISKDYTVKVVVTPAPVVAGPALGVHILDDVRCAEKARAAGCEVFTFMNMHLEASQWATGDPRKWHPGCGYPLIFYRQFHYAGEWSPAQMIEQLGGVLDHGNNNIVVTLANEWDVNIDDAGKTYAGTLKFCKWTLDCMNLLEARGFNNYAALTSSTGTPDFTSAGVCQAIKETLAPAWNSGRLRWLDMHLYSPTLGHIYDDDELPWFERRYEFLFTKCGFDPTAPGWIISTEKGLDEGGSGGFPAHNMGRDDVVRYCNRDLEIHARPIVVNGVSYPGKFLAGTLFQGSSLSWKGYDVSSYYPLPWHA